MKLRKKLLAIVGAALIATMGWAVPASATQPPADQINETPYWENLHSLDQCVKVSNINAPGPNLGTLAADGKGVKLLDSAALLVVKGGNDREVYENPAAGIHLAPKLENNPQGKYADVSFWIVCFDNPDSEVCYDQREIPKFKWVRETTETQTITEHQWYRAWEGPKEVKSWEYSNGQWHNRHNDQWYPVPSHLNPPNNLTVGEEGWIPSGTYGIPSDGQVRYRYQGGESWWPAGWPSNGTWAQSLDGAGDGAWGNPVNTRQRQVTTSTGTEYKWLKEGQTPSGDGWTLTGHSKGSGEYEQVVVDCDDSCPNIDGVQDEVPNGMYVNNAGDCVTPPGDVDVCIDGSMTTISYETYVNGQYSLFDPATCGDPTGDLQCDSVTVTFPSVYDPHYYEVTFQRLSPAGVGMNEYLLLDVTVDADHPNYGNTVHELDFTEDSRWLGWSYYRIIWLKIGDEAKSYQDDTCGEPDVEIVCWELGKNWDDPQTPPAGQASAFPQKLVDCDEVPVCVWVQKDWYDIGSDAAKEELAAVLEDGILSYYKGNPYWGPEDRDLYYKHELIPPVDCTPVPVCLWVPADGDSGDGEWTRGTVPEHEYIKGGYIDWTGNARDCYPPVEPSVEFSSYNGVCLAPEGGFSYTVTVGTYEGPLYFVLTKDGTTVVDTFGPAMDDVEMTFSADDLEPGSYTITAALPALAALHSLGQDSGPDLSFYTRSFEIVKPTDCWDLEPSEATGLCVDGVPYLDWTLEIDDPQGEFAGDARPESAVITMSDGVNSVSIPVTLDPNDYPSWSGVELWPGADFDPITGEPTAWPGWGVVDGLLQNISPDNYGWTRAPLGIDVTISFNPSVTMSGVIYPPAEAGCDDPPRYDVCEYDENEGPMLVSYYGEAPEGSIPWANQNGIECTPVDICVLTDGGYTIDTVMVTDITGNEKFWDHEFQDGDCAEPQEPTLTGSFVASLCVADSPWLDYNIVVHNPDNLPLDGVPPGEEPMAMVTFINPDGEDHVLPLLELGQGRVLWPGAAVELAEGATAIDPYDASTFVPTDWPGWFINELGEWEQHTDPQLEFGWTRNGVEVKVEVNPEFSVTVDYPPPTPTCVATPPEEFTTVLGAPPAVPVDGVATYAG